MKKHATILILLLVSFFGSSLQAEEIHSLDLYRMRVTKALHETLQKDYKSVDYQLEVSIQGKAVQSAAGEAREIQRVNGLASKTSSYLPAIEDVLGNRVYKIQKSNVRLTLEPSITEEKLADLRDIISKVAKLDANRGDEIIISVVMAQPASALSVTPQAVAATVVTATNNPTEEEGHMAKLPFLIAAVLGIFVLLWISTKRGRKHRKPVTVTELGGQNDLDQYDLLAQAHESQHHLNQDFVAQLEEKMNPIELEGEFDDFEMLTDPVTPAPTFKKKEKRVTKKQAEPVFNTELMIEPVSGYPAFQFVQGLTLQGIQRLMEGEPLSAKAWILRSMKNELVTPVLNILGREMVDDVKWELIHLSLYEIDVVKALETRLQEKANSFLQAKAPHLTAVQGTKKKVKAFDFNGLQDLPRELLKTLVGMMSVESLMVASVYSSKALQEKILLAMNAKDRKDFLISIENLHPNVEDSLIAQERMMVILKQIAEQRRLDLNKFKSA